MSTIKFSLSRFAAHPWRQFIYLLLVLVLLVTNTACTGALVIPQAAPPAVDAIHNGTSLWVMQQFARGTPYSFAMQNPQTMVTWFAAPLDNAQGWGTVAVDFAKQQPVQRWLTCGGQGTFFNCKDMAQMVQTAKDSGWQFVKPQDLPKDFPAWLAGAASWLVRSVGAVDVLIVPAGVFDTSFLPQQPVYR